MTTKAPIATPIGLFMAGYSGAGGDYIPLKSITRDIYQRLPNGPILGLKIENNADTPKQDSVIIDVIFTGPDGSMSTIHDPHVLELVTDYPVEQGNTGKVWFCPISPPRYTAFSALGIQTVTAKVAPRVAPPAGTAGATATLAARDFSPESGGKIAEFSFEIRKGPVALSPEQQMD